MKLFVFLIFTVFASEKRESTSKKNAKCEENPIIVKIEEEEYVKKKSKFIGVSYHKQKSKWQVQRRSKYVNKLVHYGYYDDEETAAHASDTLARKLMKNGEQGHKLNFCDNETEVYPDKKSSKFIGVSYDKIKLKWCVRRWIKCENKNVTNGGYDDEETAAHASDTLAKKLMKNGEQNYTLNFPDDDTDVYPKKSSKFIGMTHDKSRSKWRPRRWSKRENKMIYNGYYDDEETAARMSDTLARKLMENGEQGHKLNFPDENTEDYRENQKKKRKRPKDLHYPHDN